MIRRDREFGRQVVLIPAGWWELARGVAGRAVYLTADPAADVYVPFGPNDDAQDAVATGIIRGSSWSGTGPPDPRPRGRARLLGGDRMSVPGHGTTHAMTRPATSVYDRDEWAALVRAVRAEPGDDTPRLVAADWLDEKGEPERAELIRVQVGLARATPDERAALRKRERQLLEPGAENESADLDEEPRAANGWVELDEATRARMARGFVEEVVTEARGWLDLGDRLYRREPVRWLVISTVPAWDWVDERGRGSRAPCPRMRFQGRREVHEVDTRRPLAERLRAMFAAHWPGLEVDLAAVEVPGPADRVAPASERVRAEVPTLWDGYLETQDFGDGPYPLRLSTARLTATVPGSPPARIRADFGREFGPVLAWDPAGGRWDVRRPVLSDAWYRTIDNTTAFRARPVEFHTSAWAGPRS